MSSTSTKGMTKQMVESIRDQMHDRINAMFERLTYNENDELVDKLSYKFDRKLELRHDEAFIAGEVFTLRTRFDDLQPIVSE